MAGGPLFPFSSVPVTAEETFGNIAVVATKIDHFEGMGVAASVSPDGIWRLRFQLPDPLPSDTGKLRLLMYAEATSGDAKIEVKWEQAAPEADTPLAADLTSETLRTVTWATGDDSQLKELKEDLDFEALVAGNVVYMDLTFESTGYTLAQIMTCVASIIWEA